MRGLFILLIIFLAAFTTIHAQNFTTISVKKGVTYKVKTAPPSKYKIKLVQAGIVTDLDKLSKAQIIGGATPFAAVKLHRMLLAKEGVELAKSFEIFSLGAFKEAKSLPYINKLKAFATTPRGRAVTGLVTAGGLLYAYISTNKPKADTTIKPLKID